MNKQKRIIMKQSLWVTALILVTMLFAFFLGIDKFPSNGFFIIGFYYSIIFLALYLLGDSLIEIYG